MFKRFNSCGFTYCRPNEGVLLEFTPQDLKRARKAPVTLSASNKNDVMLEAIFQKMKVHPAFYRYRFPEHGVFLFRSETGFEEENRHAKYHVFRVELYCPGGFDCGYIVLDELKAGADMKEERVRKRSFRLRGVSKPTPVAAPEYGWFNNPDSWIYWNDAPQNFNYGVIA